MDTNGVTVDEVRAVDQELAPGVWPDMREHGAERDDWPALYERVQAANILVLCSPIWLGEESSVRTRVIERLYGNSSLLNAHGQYAYYGKVGGWLITGNEDGIKHCSMNVLSTRCSTSGTRSLRRRTRVGSAKRGWAPLTSTRTPEARGTTSPTGTRHS
jgi:multimeric flavodoxin WrbA